MGSSVHKDVINNFTVIKILKFGDIEWYTYIRTCSSSLLSRQVKLDPDISRSLRRVTWSYVKLRAVDFPIADYTGSGEYIRNWVSHSFTSYKCKVKLTFRKRCVVIFQSKKLNTDKLICNKHLILNRWYNDIRFTNKNKAVFGISINFFYIWSKSLKLRGLQSYKEVFHKGLSAVLKELLNKFPSYIYELKVYKSRMSPDSIDITKLTITSNLALTNLLKKPLDELQRLKFMFILFILKQDTYVVTMYKYIIKER